MSLQRKAMTIITLTFLLFAGSLYLVAELLLMKKFEELEAREANANIERVRNAIDEQFNFLGAKVADWVAWDDAYQFVQDGNEGFRSANLFDANGANMKVNFLIYFNAQGKPVGSFGWDLEEEAPLPVPESVSQFLSPQSAFVHHDSVDSMKSGFVQFPEGPAYVLSGPVVTGEKKGPIQGSLVVVKYFTDSELKRLSEVTRLPLAMKLWSDVLGSQDDWSVARSLSLEKTSLLAPGSKEILLGYTLLKDWSDQPLMGLKISFPRSIMGQGKLTVQTLLLAILLFGLVFGATLIALLQKSILSRIVHLASHVTNIGHDHKLVKKVEVSGNDEIGNLGRCLNGMLTSLDEHTDNMKLILENVSIGLLRCDAKGAILEGYSRICLDMLHVHEDQGHLATELKGVKLWEALGLTLRDQECFEVFYEQIFECSFLADELIENLPKRLNINHKIVQLKPSAVWNEAGELESVLFNLADITDLAAAEQENVTNQALLRILRNLDRFKELAKRIMYPAKTNSTTLEPENIILKRDLHTWKGEFAAFGLKDMVSTIHLIESNAESSAQLRDGIASVRESVNSFLLLHQSVLSIHPKDLDSKSVAVDEGRLVSLKQELRQASSTVDCKHIVNNFVSEVLHEEAGRLFQYLKDGASSLAVRLAKHIHVEIHGADVRLPIQFRSVYSTLVHLVRNAVDHGIESASERGGKPQIGTLRMEAQVKPDHYIISISDDGRGIDLKKVKETAISKGLTTEQEWNKLDEASQLAFVFRNGFSTKRDITHISGRGIGLDAVASSIRQFHGEIRMENRSGWGTQFIITIPRQQTEELQAA